MNRNTTIQGLASRYSFYRLLPPTTQHLLSIHRNWLLPLWTCTRPTHRRDGHKQCPKLQPRQLSPNNLPTTTKLLDIDYACWGKKYRSKQKKLYKTLFILKLFSGIEMYFVSYIEKKAIERISRMYNSSCPFLFKFTNGFFSTFQIPVMYLF